MTDDIIDKPQTPRDSEHEIRLYSLETDVQALKGDVGSLRNAMQNIASQVFELGKIVVEHAKLHTAHAEGVAEAKKAAHEAVAKTVSDLRAVGQHIGKLQLETATQTKMLNTLVGWQHAPWFKAAVVLGAMLGGGIVAALFAKGVLR